MLSDALQFARKASSGKLTPSTNYRANRRPSGGDLTSPVAPLSLGTPLGEKSDSASNLMARIDPQQFDRSSLTTPRTSNLTGGDVLAPPPHMRGRPHRSRCSDGSEPAAPAPQTHRPPAAPAAPPTPAAPARPTKAAPNHSAARGARLSLGLTRIVHQATELQRWISTPAAVAAPLAQAEGLIERLEAAETALASLQSLLAGESGRPNRMSALLRQVDKENALDGARGEEKCTANVHMLLGNLSASVASSAASTAKRLASTQNALAGVPPAADAAIEQAEAALAGIVPSAPLNVRPRSSPNRRPPAMLDLDAEGGGDGPISADAAARERGRSFSGANARPASGRPAHADAGVDVLTRGLPPPLRSAASGAPAARRPAQLSRKLSFTGDAPPAGRQTPSPPMPKQLSGLRSGVETVAMDGAGYVPRRRTESPKLEPLA